MFAVLEGDEGEIVSDTITDTGRWSVHHELIFKLDDKVWRTRYSVGATESQDESPWEYEAEVSCQQVIAVEKLVTVWADVG